MRKEILILAAVIVAFSLASPVFASSYNIEMSQVNNNLLVKHLLSRDSAAEVKINIPSDAYSISSKQNYSLEKGTLTIIGKNIEFSYLTNEALQKSDKGYYLVDNIKFNLSIDNATIKLLLDKGYFLDNEHIYPPPSKIETDGRQISLTWEISNVKEGDTLPIFLTMLSPPPSSNFLMWIVLLIALVVISYIIYKFYTKRTVKEKGEDLEKYLIESEKAVLRELKQADRGELWQKQLQLKTNFSKAKLSRVIRNLESRNLVEKIPFGNTNKVRLK